MSKYINIFFAIFFIAICAVFLHLISELPPDDPGMEKVGIGMFPLFCISMITFLSVFMAILSIIFPLKESELPNKISSIGKKRIFAIIILMFLYISLYEIIGFYIGTLLFSIIALYIIGEKNYKIIYVYPILLIVGIHIAFVQILGVVLPVGDLLYNILN